MNREILSNQEAVARRAADLVCELCRGGNAGREARGDEAINVSLSGGTTPRVLYQLLATSPWREAMPWDRVRWFFGDERTVPLDHQDSNYRMVRDAMFLPAGVARELQFPVPHIGVAPPMQVASDYELEVQQLVKPKSQGSAPSFDLMLLGVGTDGHTASLFPHSKALKPPPGRVIEANYVDKLQTWRITVTPDVIRQAKRILVLVTGEDKAKALQHVLEGEADFFLYPAQIARDLDCATWLIDESAAGLLTPQAQ